MQAHTHQILVKHSWLLSLQKLCLRHIMLSHSPNLFPYYFGSVGHLKGRLDSSRLSSKKELKASIEAGKAVLEGDVIKKSCLQFIDRLEVVIRSNCDNIGYI